MGITGFERRAIRTSTLLLAGVLAVSFVTRTAHAYCRATTAMPMPEEICSEKGEVLAWHRQCITYSVVPGNDTPKISELRQAVDRSFRTWSEIECNGHPIGIELSQTSELGACKKPQYNRHASNANTIYFLDDWEERGLADGVFGITLVWHDIHTGVIFDADMQINETLGPLRVCDETCPEGTIDIENVVTHEAGHFLGLGHSEVRESTMAEGADIGDTDKRDLEEDDRKALCSIYGKFPAAACGENDFVPDHGWAAECAPPKTATARSEPSCSVVSPGREHARGAVGVGSFVLAACITSWRLRRRSRRERGCSR